MKRLSASAGGRSGLKDTVFVACLTVILAVGVIAASCGGSGGGIYGGSTQTTVSAPDTTAPGGAGGVQVVMENLAFDPASITIKAGESVTWTNNDSTTHTITADNGEFESSSIAAGSTFTFQFDNAGTYAYHCSIHPSMKATVVVE